MYTDTVNKTGKERFGMKGIIYLVLIIGAWFFVQSYVLPKLGFKS